MAKRSSLAVILLAALGAATSQGAIRWYMNDYEGALEMARKTGRPLVIIFHPAEDKLRSPKKMFDSDQLAPYHRLFVFVYNEVTIKDGTFSHGLFNKYNPGAGQRRLPIIIIADTDEKAILQFENPQKVGDIESELKSALKKLGGPTTPKKSRDAQEALDRANALLAKKQYGAAAKAFKEVVDLNLKTPGTETAKKELAKIEDMAKKLLESARADVTDKAYPEAIRKLSELDEAFSPLAEAKEAREELAKLRKLPEVKEAIEKAEREKKEPVAARPAPRPTDDPTDVANDYFTDEELEALDKLGAGEEAPTPKDVGPAAECRRLLALARSWIANKENTKAMEILDKIIQKYPDTAFADQAKALLEQMKKR